MSEERPPVCFRSCARAMVPLLRTASEGSGYKGDDYQRSETRMTRCCQFGRSWKACCWSSSASLRRRRAFFERLHPCPSEIALPALEARITAATPSPRPVRCVYSANLVGPLIPFPQRPYSGFTQWDQTLLMPATGPEVQVATASATCRLPQSYACIYLYHKLLSNFVLFV